MRLEEEAESYLWEEYLRLLEVIFLFGVDGSIEPDVGGIVKGVL